MAKRKKAATKPTVTPVAEPRDDLSPALRIAWWSLLAMVFITPLAIANMSWLGIATPISFDQFDIVKVFCQRFFTLIALSAWAWHILMKGGKIRRTPVDWLILGFLAWVTLSTILSIHPPTALLGKYRRFEGLLSFINYAVIYFLVLQFADRPSRVKRLAQTLFFSGALVALYGVMQAVGIEIMNWQSLPFEAQRSFSTYGNPDLLGGFLMFSTFISAGLALAEKNLVWRAVYWFGFLLNSVCLITAFTRSAWVGSAVGFVLLAVFAVWQRAPWKTEDWVFSGATASLVAFAVIRSLSSQNDVMNFAKRFASIFNFGEGSAKTRFEIWGAAIDAVKDRPLFGFGPDTFRLVFPKYKPIEYVADAGYLSVADNVHNYPLQLASGIGIPGVLLLYGIFGWAAWRSAPIVFNREGGQHRMILAAFWTACAAYIVHLFFGLSVTGSSFLLWASMAVVLAPTATAVEVRPRYWGVFAASAVLLLAAAGIVYQFVFISADRAYLMARVASQGAQRTAYAEKAVRLNPWNDIYRAEVGLALIDETIGWVNQASQAPADQQQQVFESMRASYSRAESSLLETIEFVPWEYDNYVFISNLYTLGGQFIDPSHYERAVAWARKGVEVEPYGPAIRFQLARALAETGKVEEAIKEAKFAHEMDTAYTDAALLLAGLYEQAGRPEEAAKALKETLARVPDAPGLKEALSRLESSSTTTP